MRSSFANFRSYAQSLRRLAVAVGESDPAQWSDSCRAALDGEPNKELCSAVDLATRRAHGTFFTGSKLAQRLVRQIDLKPLRSQVFLDPTCGVGDLLLAVAHHLPKKRTLHETLSSWGDILQGIDREPSFVAATKSRLVLLARQRLGALEFDSPRWDRIFPSIKVGDAFGKQVYERATCVLLNPPFGRTQAPEDCSWGSGLVNAAGIFLLHAIEQARPGSSIIGILPEVLRTGSRYEKWRELVARKAHVQGVETYGVFDASADVHVFLLSLRTRAETAKIGQFGSARTKTKENVASFFDVGVGAVVPYRDPKSGPTRRYIHPRNVPAWSKVARVNETRRFDGRVVKPPFVVIRRTSRPGDKFRATAATVLGARPVAVENHLVVCKPRDGLVTTCERLVAGLKTDAVNKFLDARMRCRHLTVGIVKQIPIDLSESPVKSTT